MNENNNNNNIENNTNNNLINSSNNNIDLKKQQIKEKISFYINISKKDTNYDETLKTNPESLFTFITNERIDFWEKKLFSEKKNFSDLQNSDILSTEPNHPNQKIIKNDVARSRVRESILIPGFSSILQSFITFYVKKRTFHTNKV